MPYDPGYPLLDKYRIEKTLGQGAFAEVFLVTHLRLNVPRVVKVLRRDAPGMGSRDYAEIQARFLLEGQLGARLNKTKPNPRLLQIYDSYIDENLSLLEMEYAAGGSLAQRIQNHRDQDQLMPVEEALRVAAEVAEGLAALHALGIVHRDVKPANILFDEEGHARLADLGLAQVPGGGSQRSQLSEPKPQPGTPGYMSPEQENSGAYLTPASDIYSLGATLFEMLTGRVQRSLRPGTRAASLRADLTVVVDDLLARMLAKMPEERVWDGDEAAGLLREVLDVNSGAARLRKEKEAEEEKQRQAEAQARLQVEEYARKVAEEARQRKEKELAEQARRQTEEERKPRGLIIELAPGVTMEFVRVPAGEFLMGSDPKKDNLARGNEQPQHKVTLDEYLIGKYPVTNRQYQAFVQAAGRKSPQHWSGNKIPAGKDNHPVVCVSWQEASDFCAWAGKISGSRVRLPSEAEWEKAARGTDGRIYPWGDQAPDAQRCNFYLNVDDTTPVGQYSPQGDSPYGCADMAGNVWEWAADWFDGSYYAKSPASNPNGPASGKWRVLRGGSWYSYVSSVRSAYRIVVDPSKSNDGVGFRCARSPSF